jgi:hypothetical protein
VAIAAMKTRVFDLVARCLERPVRRAVPVPLLVVAFHGDDPVAEMIVADTADNRPIRIPAPPIPRFHIAEMVDDIGLVDLRLLRTAFSLAEVTAALRDATGIAALEVALADCEIIDALLAGALSRRQIGSMIRSRKLTTSLSARDLAALALQAKAT